MTTLDNDNEQQSSTIEEELDTQSIQEAKKVAKEKLARLQASQETNAPWINAPKNIGDELVLGFDASKSKDDTAQDKYTKPTTEEPNPRRPVTTFTVRTKDGYWKRINLTRPNQAMEVFGILAEADDGCSWIKLKRVATNKGTRVEFTAVE